LLLTLLLFGLAEEILSIFTGLGSALLEAGSLVMGTVRGVVLGFFTLARTGLSFTYSLAVDAYSLLTSALGALGRGVANDPWVQGMVVLVVACVEIGILYGVLRSPYATPGRGGGLGFEVRSISLRFPRLVTLRSRIYLFLVLYLPLLVVAEVLVLGGSATTGLLLHFAAISVAIAAGALLGVSEEPEESGYRVVIDIPEVSSLSRRLTGGEAGYVFYAFSLIPIMRVANLTLPLDLFSPLLQVVVINAVVLVGVVTAIRGDPGIIAGLSYLPQKKHLVEWVLGLLVALPLGFLVSTSFDHSALGLTGSAISLARLFLVAIFFVALTEEVLFRAFLQRWLTPVTGPVPAILMASVMGAAMVLVWGSLLYVYFALALGLLLGLLFHRTGSITLVILVHGLVEFGVFSYPALF
jgi:membrane protease YdiL (CAAX protease family)